MAVVLVLCGPPCSGKSSISTALLNRPEFKSWRRFEMDQIRLLLTPSSHTAEDRANAYKYMHEQAETAIRAGAPGVILDATYQPPKQRRAISNLAAAVGADVVVVECHVEANRAVERFKGRKGPHAAIDLTAEKVWDLAHGFPYLDELIPLDTTKETAAQIADIVARLNARMSIHQLERWIQQAGPISSASPNIPKSDALKLNSTSRKIARRNMRLRGIVIGLSLLFAFISFIITVKAFSDTFFPSAWQWGSLVEPAGWAQVWAALALISLGLGGTIEYFSNGSAVQRDREVLSAGDLPALFLHESTPANKEIYWRYKRRIVEDQENRLLIEDLPLWFLVPPAPLGFDVKLERYVWGRVDLDYSELEKRSASVGLDWHGYSAWRTNAKGDEYYSRSKEICVRVFDGAFDPEGVLLKVCEGDYPSHLMTELSANLVVDGRYGYELRQILEGPAWIQSDPCNSKDRIDLRDLRGASRTFEILLSVQVALTTSDGYLILQRRSNRVQSSVGGMSSSSAGVAQWRDLFVGRQSLLETAIRETREEIAWSPHPEDKFFKPFLGAAFNLLRGRDLNFYCHLHTHRSLGDILTDASRAKDRWEVAHLVPVPVTAIRCDGSLAEPFSDLVGDARHLRGMLFCLAKSQRLKELQESILTKGGQA